MKASDLPERMLKCVDPTERKKLKLRTAQEAIEAAEIKSEKELQRQIVALLNLKGIEVNVSRMDKRKTDRVGWPDLTFAVADVYAVTDYFPCSWEIKLPGHKLTPEQSRMFERLQKEPNGWTCRVITSVDQALQELKVMGIGG